MRLNIFLTSFLLLLLISCSNDTAIEGHSPSLSPEQELKARLLSRVQALADSTLPQAAILLDSAQRIFLEAEDHFALGVAYNKQADLAQQLEETEKSADLTMLASSAYETADSLLLALRNAGAAGMKYLSLGAYAKSTQALQRRLELARLKNDSSAIGWSLNALSLPYQYSYNMPQAQAYLFEAQKINTSLNDQRLEAAITLNLGNVYSDEKQYDQSIAFYQKSHRIASEVGHERIKWLCLNNIANAHLKQSNYAAVIEILSKLDKDGLDNVSPQNKLLLHYNIARAYLGIGDIPQATYHANQNCELSATIRSERGNIDCIELKALLAESNGELEEALFMLKEYHRLEEESTGEETDKQLQIIKESYEVKIRDQEITELKEQEVSRRRQEYNQRVAIIGFIVLSILAISGIIANIRASSQSRITNQQKEIAEAQLHFLQARMSPHFVFNALNGIQNQILQANPFSAYEYVGKFAGLLRVITDTTSKPEILLSDEVSLLQNYLDLEQLRFRDGFSYSIDVSDDLASLNPMVPAMMVQPVLENAIIHGFSASGVKGKIRVEISLQEETICCVVTDNGIGREASAKNSQEEKTQHLSISTENLRKRFKALARLGHSVKPFTITDLFDGEKASGTQVTLYLPIIPKNS